MARSLSEVDQHKRDGLRLVDVFASALAYADMSEACKLAADYIESPVFTGDNDPDQLEVIAAFVKLLRSKTDRMT